MFANNGTLSASTTKMIRDADAAPPDSTAPASASAARRRWRPDALLIVLLAGALIYAGFLGFNLGAYAGGSDSSGYLNNARLLKFGQTRVATRTVPGLPASALEPYVYIPLGFSPVETGEMVPTYPIGLPLFLAGTAFITGWESAPNWTMWFHALAGVALMFALGRCAGLPRGWSALGALLLALCPLYLMFSLQLMSDVPASTWAMATILFVWLSRENLRWAPAAGFALGLAVLVRPTNALLIVPAAIALGTHWRRWLLFLAGGVPPAIALLVYNASAYGHPLASGYGQIGELFQLTHVPTTLAHYAEWLPVLLTPFGLVALGLPFCARRSPRWSLLLAVWILAWAGLYACYYHTHETWWYLRFLLPAFPAAWIAALLVAHAAWQRLGFEKRAPVNSPAAWFTGALAAVAIFAYTTRWNRVFNVSHTGREERLYPDSAAWLKTAAPDNAIIVAMQVSGSLFYYTKFPIVRWDQLGHEDFARVTAAAEAAQRPLFAFLFPFEEERAFGEKRLTGQWSKVGRHKNVQLWRFESSLGSP